MTDVVDYGRYTEAELLDIAASIDPRRAGENLRGLSKALEAIGYVVEVNELGQVSVSFTPGAPRRFMEVPTRFSQSRGPAAWMEPSRNDFRLVGSGNVRVDNGRVHISGKALNFFLGFAFPTRVKLDREHILNVETTGCAVRFEYAPKGFKPKALTLHVADSFTAEQLVNLLPHTRTSDFQSKLPGELDFDWNVLLHHPHVPVTIVLVVANFAVFLAMTVAGAGFFRLNAMTELAWGSNFGPFATDGDWWRLFTSNFLHLGVLHLLLNMWALSAIGPLVERLYGSLRFLFIYLSAGVLSSLASIAWTPVQSSVGASGPIFGVYGALLAALAVSGQSIPGSLIAPLRTSTAVFVVSALAAGFLWRGIDNAAHLGGLTAGFPIGLVLTRPFATQDTRRSTKVLRAAATAVAVAVTIATGWILAQYRVAHSGADGLFWQTQHWMVKGEAAAQQRWINIQRLVREQKLDDAGFASAIDSSVLPFWREADRRLRELAPPSNATVVASLQNLRALATSRKNAFEVCVTAGRAQDAAKATQCSDELRRGDQMIEGFRTGRGAQDKGAH